MMVQQSTEHKENLWICLCGVHHHLLQEGQGSCGLRCDAHGPRSPCSLRIRLPQTLQLQLCILDFCLQLRLLLLVPPQGRLGRSQLLLGLRERVCLLCRLVWLQLRLGWCSIGEHGHGLLGLLHHLKAFVQLLHLKLCFDNLLIQHVSFILQLLPLLGKHEHVHGLVILGLQQSVIHEGGVKARAMLLHAGLDSLHMICIAFLQLPLLCCLLLQRQYQGPPLVVPIPRSPEQSLLVGIHSGHAPLQLPEQRLLPLPPSLCIVRGFQQFLREPLDIVLHRLEAQLLPLQGLPCILLLSPQLTGLELEQGQGLLLLNHFRLLLRAFTACRPQHGLGPFHHRLQLTGGKSRPAQLLLQPLH
mmetsp:Transcript_50911/g.90975  ORF Transcript_50911/g.90975 Transcript_50911/m.90975 type:complete len:358 (-) Transcript_50911:770-1843(-)